MVNINATNSVPLDNSSAKIDNSTNAAASASSLAFAMQSLMQQVAGTAGLSDNFTTGLTDQKIAPVHHGGHHHKVSEADQLAEAEQQIETNAELAINNLPFVNTPENNPVIPPANEHSIIKNNIV